MLVIELVTYKFTQPRQAGLDIASAWFVFSANVPCVSCFFQRESAQEKCYRYHYQRIL